MSVIYKTINGKKLAFQLPLGKNKNITLEDDTFGIFQYAFADSIINNIKLNNNLKYIYNHAFENSNIKEIILPKSVEKISPNAFKNCIYLTHVQINNKYCDFAPYVFKECISLTNVELNGLDTISTGMFCFCQSIKNINLDGVRVIQSYAFIGTNIEKLILPKSLEEIGDDVFTPKKLKSIKYEGTREDFYKIKGIEQIDKILKNNKHIKLEFGKTIDDMINEGKSIKEINNIFKQENER